MKKFSFLRHDLPLDLLHPILEQLTDRRDLAACVLVSKSFNRAATPLLYAILDSRVFSKNHPSSTILQLPHLARYVRHVTETAAVHRQLRSHHPNITQDILRALALCTHLRSMTWIDDVPSAESDTFFLALISVVRILPLRSLTVRTYGDLGQDAWAQLTTLTGLQKICIWCLEGPPSNEWTDGFRNTLSHLELGVSVFTSPCSDLLSGLVSLQDLRLKGAPSHAIPKILALLPNLQSLDTEYIAPSPTNPSVPPVRNTVAALRHLTVRTSNVDTRGPLSLWGWITSLLPHRGLETLKLHAFTLHRGHTRIPRAFVLDLAARHAGSLVHFLVGAAELSLADVTCLCGEFPQLESLECLIVAGSVEEIKAAVVKAASLRTLRLQVQSAHGGEQLAQKDWTLEQAQDWMLSEKHSLLRVISINSVVYTGRWILDSEGDLKLEVIAYVERDKWNT